MATLPFLEAYAGQTTDELIALEGQYRVDSIVAAFEEALLRQEDRLGADALTTAEWTILAIEAMEREVNNGGYDQFFRNSSREHAAILVEALRSIRCPQVADISRRAIDALQLDGPPTPDRIEAALDEDRGGRDAELGALDDEYYAAGEDIAGNLFAFIRQHADQIRLP